MTAEICGDNRFEIIEAAKKRLLESTNIEDSPEEMAVLDSFLFRCWQMGWLPGCECTEKTCEGCDIPNRDYGHGIRPCDFCSRARQREDLYTPKVVS